MSSTDMLLRRRCLCSLFVYIVSLTNFLSSTRSYEYQQPHLWAEPSNIVRARQIAEVFFPNVSHRLFEATEFESENMRKLVGFHPIPDDLDSISCFICSNLKYCKALNSLLIQERYYPGDQLSNSGTCGIIDNLGKRVRDEIFGNGKTFRDTPLCRDIVMQYLCLFWGSDNLMYTNYCVYKEDVTSSDPTTHRIAPKPPCRSFCVQVADICANDPDFVNLCYNIQCPPTEDECSPDPIVGGSRVASGIGCSMPYTPNPYNVALPDFVCDFCVLCAILIGTLYVLLLQLLH